MWVRKRLDIGWLDLVFGGVAVMRPAGRARLARAVEARFSPRGDALACLSVRSGFDLLWQALALPRGSEVLISAINVPDMVRILQQHGLTPLPLDIAPRSMAPDLDAVRRTITPATRAIVVAHLLGGRIPLDGLVELARERGLLLVEDCAQAFDGSGWTGHPESDAAMFSFGTIKTATALGGAVLRVRDPWVLQQMREALAAQPVQSRSQYLSRLLKYALLKAACLRVPFTVLVKMFQLLGLDHDRFLNKLVRGFAGPNFFERIRRQPSAPLLAMLERRLSTFNAARLAERAARGRQLREHLASADCCPGEALEAASAWIFPVLSREPVRLIAALNAAGFDATQGKSLCVIPPPENRPQAAAAIEAERLLAGMVNLPLYPELPLAELDRMAGVVLSESATLDRLASAAPVASRSAHGSLMAAGQVP